MDLRSQTVFSPIPNSGSYRMRNSTPIKNTNSNKQIQDDCKSQAHLEKLTQAFIQSETTQASLRQTLEEQAERLTSLNKLVRLQKTYSETMEEDIQELKTIIKCIDLRIDKVIQHDTHKEDSKQDYTRQAITQNPLCVFSQSEADQHDFNQDKQIAAKFQSNLAEIGQKMVQFQSDLFTLKKKVNSASSQNNFSPRELQRSLNDWQNQIEIQLNKIQQHSCTHTTEHSSVTKNEIQRIPSNFKNKTTVSSNINYTDSFKQLEERLSSKLASSVDKLRLMLQNYAKNVTNLSVKVDEVKSTLTRQKYHVSPIEKQRVQQWSQSKNTLVVEVSPREILSSKSECGSKSRTCKEKITNKNLNCDSNKKTAPEISVSPSATKSTVQKQNNRVSHKKVEDYKLEESDESSIHQTVCETPCVSRPPLKAVQIQNQQDKQILSLSRQNSVKVTPAKPRLSTPNSRAMLQTQQYSHDVSIDFEADKKIHYKQNEEKRNGYKINSRNNDQLKLSSTQPTSNKAVKIVTESKRRHSRLEKMYSDLKQVNQK